MVGKWYQGPIFVAGVKFVILFAIFTSIVGESFYFGIPHLDPYVYVLLSSPLLYLLRFVRGRS